MHLYAKIQIIHEMKKSFVPTMGTNFNIYLHYSTYFMAKIKQIQPDQDVKRLGLEVARLLKEEANLTTAWVRTESHFGDEKFSAFKRGALTT